jgi:zinc transport system ATP-binding protein
MKEDSQPVIRMDKVCFAYRTREVLHNVSFELQQEDMMAVVGPNGGGKTTLVQLILGLLTPLHGQISLFGSPPSQTRHQVGYVPQKLETDPLFPISVAEVVKLGLLNHPRISSKTGSDQVLAALEQTGAAHLADRPFSSLSGGEKQRVLIGHALVSQPRLLLMDEPTANVDPQSEHDLYQLFKELSAKLPILFVSHNLNVVSRYVNRVLCVNRTACAHSIQDVMDHSFTELFGGEMALIHHGPHCQVVDPSAVLNPKDNPEGHIL